MGDVDRSKKKRKSKVLKLQKGLELEKENDKKQHTKKKMRKREKEVIVDASEVVAKGEKKKKKSKEKSKANADNGTMAQNTSNTLRDADESEDQGKIVGKHRKQKKSKKEHKKEHGTMETEKTIEKQEHPDQSDVYRISLGDADVSEDQVKIVGTKIKHGKQKKSKKERKKEHAIPTGVEKTIKKQEYPDQDDVYCISSGDEDNSKGMKKWLTEYHQSRPGLKVLQQRIDEFIVAHEEKLEQERKEKEAKVAEDGWTVVTHHKGRKKTTDAETGITVGSVAPAVVQDQLAKKKRKEVGQDFYRFQKREAQMNEILKMRSKFEEDKKRIQQLRAARKFRPY